MDYVRLGRAGVKVSRLCLGTAFRGYWHGHTDEGDRCADGRDGH